MIVVLPTMKKSEKETDYDYKAGTLGYGGEIM